MQSLSPVHAKEEALICSNQSRSWANCPSIGVSVDHNKFDEATGSAGKRVISWNHFKQIKEKPHHAFEDSSAETTDPWWPVSELVTDCNANRQKWIVATLAMVLDESMINFQPRTAKTSISPFLSFIFQKPKPLGTEFKTVACTKTGTPLHLEMQCGAIPMHLLQFHSDVGATAACTLRLILAAAHSGQVTMERQQFKADERRHIATGDSWFGSVKVAEACKLLRRAGPGETATCEGYLIDRTTTPKKGHEFTGAIKTNKGWFPESEMESKMKDWPSGSHLVMETTAPETGVKLVAIGCRCNTRKSLFFAMTKDAGSATPGSPCKAKFPDQCGNIMERKVTCPDVLSFCFETSTLIDSHNHAKQHLLALERFWKTPNPWFRTCSTLIGMTVIDAWKGLKHQMPHLCGNVTVEEFADRMACDCCHNGFQKSAAGTAQADIAADGIARDHQTELPTVLLWPMASLADNLRDMTVQCCSSASPLTVDSTDVFSFGRPHNAPPSNDHDATEQRAKDATKNAPAKRRCVVCGTDTRNECSDGRCHATCHHHNGVECSGIPIWSTRAQVRAETPWLDLTNNTKICLQRHRDTCCTGESIADSNTNQTLILITCCLCSITGSTFKGQAHLHFIVIVTVCPFFVLPVEACSNAEDSLW